MDKAESLIWSLEQKLQEANEQAKAYCDFMFESPGNVEFPVTYWQWVGKRKALAETLELVKNTFGG